MSFTFAFCSPTIVMLENTSLPEAYLPVGRQAGPSADGQGGSMAMDGPVSKTKTDLPAHRAEAPYRLVRAEAKPISLRPAPDPSREPASLPTQPGQASGRLPQPWRLPERGLALYHGLGETARLSHYFLPRLIQSDKNVLVLDGANAFDPRLLERLARSPRGHQGERGVEFSEFCRRIRVARAFTCFQLTELVARVPRFLADFPAQVLVVTALPDLYFDEDIRDGDARVAFERALRNLQRYGCGGPGALPQLAVAVFSSAADFSPSPARRQFFARASAAAGEVWRYSLGEDGRPKLLLEKQAPLPSPLTPLPQGRGCPSGDGSADRRTSEG